MGAIGQTLMTFWESTGIANFGYQNGIMIVAALFFLYLAIRHGFEPLLLVPIAFGMLLSNLPMTAIFLNDVVHEGITNSNQLTDAGIFSIFYLLKPVLPSLIFLGVGAMTDFGPLIANPKSLLMGAAAQLGIFFAFFSAIALGFTAQEAGSIGIIGGADGPTAIYLTGTLADHLLELGAKVLMIKCGAPGIYFRTAGRERLRTIGGGIGERIADTWADVEYFEESYHVDQVLSGTGAGDTTIAGFLTALLEGCSWQECLHLAAAAGASCVQTYDSLSGLPTLAELKEKIRRGWSKDHRSMKEDKR